MLTRAKFVQAIRDFKKKQGGKLKDLLNQESNPEAVKAFWSDPIIQAYLARPSVTFIDKHPQLRDSTTKVEHDFTDHYELKIYKYLPNAVVYRNNNITSPKFYTSGTSPHYDLFGKLLKSFSEGSPDINVMEPCDIYVIASMATSMFLEPETAFFPRFLLNANWKDDHASALLTILDPLTGRALITLFMNSWQIEDYYEYSKKRFLMDQSNSLRLQATATDEDSNVVFMKNYLNKSFSIDIDSASLLNQPATLLVNKDEKAIFTINYTYSDYSSLEYRTIEESPDIETRYSFKIEKYRKPPAPVLSVTHTSKIPFINVSHHLQQGVDDQNCVLYSMNFIQAMVEMLKQPEVADRVFELARTVKSDSGAIKKLVHIFQEDLKTYLPCYYDIATGMPKSCAELEAFHLNQRWEIGRKSLSILQPIEQTVSIEVLSDASSCTGEKIVVGPPLETTVLNMIAPKIDLHVEQGINDRPLVIVLPDETTNNSQLIELSIQNNEPRASALNTGVEYSDAASGLMKTALLQKIQAMQKYGVLLKDQNASKGQVIIDLANDLTIMANQFFDQEPEQRNFAEFEPRFSELLHSKDQEVSAYRIAWGTIVSNIAIALTGVGFLFIVGKLIHSKVTENRALFFFQKSKTTSEEKIADVEHAASLIAQST